ncbi:hypothetical protein ABBQ32_010870 [Trebouxia sp. C0010 RCD-2024]
MSSESEDGETVNSEWNLGFVQPPGGPYSLLRHQFRSKAWLDPLQLPSPTQLTCGRTGKTFNFLLQIYAPPPEDVPQAFHRVVYVFISQQGSHLKAPGAVKALRCQLPRSNPYYSPEPPRASQKLPPSLQAEDLAQATNPDPWQVAQYEASLAAGETPADPPGGVHLLKELELVVEAEGEGGGATSEEQSHMQRLMRAYESRRASEGELSEQDMPKELLADVEANQNQDDRHFAHFAAVVAEAPGQCLRYCFDEGAEPLWPSRHHTPVPQDIPACQYCGSARRFEFQVLPQLLHYMDVDAEDPEGPDWGCIAVYSCPNSCTPIGKDDQSSYVEEFAWVQPP